MGEKIATRAAYGQALVELGAERPDLVVLDADLSGSPRSTRSSSCSTPTSPAPP